MEKLEKLRKENEDLLFQNNVLKVENEFMKKNIKRLNKLNDIDKENKYSLLKKCKNKLKKFLK